jgi:hypothetical protein
MRDLSLRAAARTAFPMIAAAAFLMCVPGALAQSSAGAGTATQQPSSSSEPAPPPATTSSAPAHPWHATPGVTYQKPTEGQKFHNFMFDAFGPIPIIGAAAAAGVNQATNSPPEWGGGGQAYAERFGSNFGIALITTTTRYGLAEAFHEDTLYYRCECHGFFPRLTHALISTVTARKGEDGHRVFSFPGLAAPYAGTMVAVAGWYPNRYEPMDGFRLGNYNLLYQAGGNVALEFLWGGPHTLLGKSPMGLHPNSGDDSKSN